MLTEMIDIDAIEEILAELIQMEEERFIAGCIKMWKNNDIKHGMTATSKKNS